MIVLDTSGLVALLDRGEKKHRSAHRSIEGEPGPLVVIDVVLAEADHLLLHRLGRAAERDFWAQVQEGVFLREAVDDRDLRHAAEIAERFSSKGVGMTDATVMAVAERLEVLRVLTLDRKHFGHFRTRRGKPLQLLPADGVR